MKHIKLLSLLIFSVIIYPTNVFSETFTCESSLSSSNSAFIPHWKSGNPSSSYVGEQTFYVSNISSSTVSVTVKLYDHSGSILGDDGAATSGVIGATGSFSNYNDSSNITFDLAPNSTIEFYVNTGTSLKRGYGTIQWTSTADLDTALVAYTRRYVDQYGSSTKWRSHGVAVNQGMPF